MAGLLGKTLGKAIGKTLGWPVDDVSTMYGITSFSNTAGYQTANGAGEQGDATTGFAVAMLLSVDSQGVTTNNRVIRGVNDATGTTYGWQIRTQTTNATLQFGIRQAGNGTLTFTGSFTVTAAMVGKVLHVVGVVDIAALCMRLYVDNVLVGTETTITGYALPDTSVPDAIGRLSVAASGADGITVYGTSTGHGPMTQPEVAAHRALCVAAGDIVPVTGAGCTAVHTHSVKAQLVSANDFTTVPTTIADTTGSSTMTKQGSPTLNVRTNPPWV